MERPLEIGRLPRSIRTFHEADADQEIAARQVFTLGVLVLIGRLDFGLAGNQRIVSAGKFRQCVPPRFERLCKSFSYDLVIRRGELSHGILDDRVWKVPAKRRYDRIPCRLIEFD